MRFGGDAVFKERLYDALQLRGMKAADLAKKVGVSRGTISQYLSGYSEPKSVRLYEIAKALSVSEMWLMGFDVPIERDDRDFYTEETARIAQEIYEDKDLRALMSAARDADPAAVKAAHAFLRTLKEQEMNWHNDDGA